MSLSGHQDAGQERTAQETSTLLGSRTVPAAAAAALEQQQLPIYGAHAHGPAHVSLRRRRQQAALDAGEAGEAGS